ncbi:MAG: hypothetical protein AAF772_12930, partial [Acidobacteriota bacterium]
MPLTHLLLGLLMMLGPDGHRLRPLHASPDSLPLTHLDRVLDQVWLVEHQQANLPFMHYQPAAPGATAAMSTAFALGLASARMPTLRAPRIWLRTDDGSPFAAGGARGG